MADAESVLVGWLTTTFPDARICTETPANLDTLVAAGTDIIAVSRFGGSDEEVATFDNASMDFDCYSSTRPLARTLAYAVRSAVRNDLPAFSSATVSVGRVRSISGPTWTPYQDTNVRRFTYSAQIRLHSLEA